MSNVNITNTNNTVQPTIILNTVSVVTSETQVDVTNPVTNVVEVIHIGPQGTQGIQGIQGETGLTITDLFVYRGSNTWSTTGSLQISSSLIISQSVTGLSGFTGSLLGTASWAHSASQAISSSHYAETDPIFVAKSASLATTGSNTFRGTQIISGSGQTTILQVHAANSEPWAFGIYNDSYSSTTQGLAGWIDVTGEANIGTEVDKPIRIYTSASYNNPTLIISSSGVTVGAGGITGSLFGTASWARNAVTASYILSSNVSGPNGFDSVNYASSAGSADAVANPLTQDLQIRGLLSNQILVSDLENIVSTVTTSTGNVINGTLGNGLSIGSLCYLDYNTPAWELVDQTTNSATKLLAICTDTDTGYFLLDGKITLDSSYVGGTLQVGAPIYLSGSGQFTANVASLTTGYVRLVGHLLHRSGANYILNFRPDHTWIEL
jgi:hypothetical protein